METAFFLASNSGKGFYSMYDSFPGEGNYLHIIKGGPGTGKSSFMRAIASAAIARGMDAELILCSADPDSLDGLFVPALKTAWVDGTAPHVREASIFGVNSDYVNLGEFYKGKMNKVSSARAIELNCQHKRLYSEAYSFLAAEAAAAEAYEGEPLEHDELQRVGEMIRDILNGEMHRSAKGEGRMLRRFISAVGANGKVLLQDTVNKLCKQNYFFENPLHAHQILSSAADTAVELGLDAILCPEPLRPERLEALLLPELGLAFSAAYGDDEGRGLNISFGRARPERQTGQDEAMIRAKLRHEATKRLSRAKAVHDELEGLHRPQMDFAALTEFTGKYIKDIFN